MAIKGRRGHYQLAMANINEVYRRPVRRGFRFLHLLKDTARGKRQAWLLDPDDEVIGLSGPIPKRRG